MVVPVPLASPKSEDGGKICRRATSARAWEESLPFTNKIYWQENADFHKFQALVPGMRTKDVSVQIVDENVLEIRGQSGVEYFVKHMKLPADADAKCAYAYLGLGILTLVIPKHSDTEEEDSVGHRQSDKAVLPFPRYIDDDKKFVFDDENEEEDDDEDGYEYEDDEYVALEDFDDCFYDYEWDIDTTDDSNDEDDHDDDDDEDDGDSAELLKNEYEYEEEGSSYEDLDEQIRNFEKSYEEKLGNFDTLLCDETFEL